MDSTIIVRVERHAATQPGKLALVAGSRTLDYGQLWRCANAAAHWLRHVQALAPGDRVVMAASSKDPWFPAIYLGTHLAGAVAVPLDERLGEAAKRYVLERVAPALSLLGPEGSALREVLAEVAASAAAPPPAERRPALGDVADIMFTSGSTGSPKGVVLTHGNINASASNINAFIGNTSEDREVVTVPLSHSFGLGRLRCNLLTGGTVILVPGLTFPALTFEALARHRATGLASVPAGFALMIRAGRRELAGFGANLKYTEIGSARMDRSQKLELMGLLPSTRLCMHYGLTEASRSAFIEFHCDVGHIDSIGRPTPNVAIQVTDADGQPLPPGRSGRIRIRAATVMKEYWLDQERTDSALDPDGWLDSGDLGHFDAEGYLHFEGRQDDLINVGGRKVYPLEVEDAATALDAVAECACVAAPDPDGLLGEVPALYVVAKDGAPIETAQIIRHLRREVAPYAVPRVVRFVSELPRTDNGKIRRAMLRTREFGAGDAAA